MIFSRIIFYNTLKNTHGCYFEEHKMSLAATNLYKKL